MIKIEFSEDERKKLQHERFHHPVPQVQRKLEAVYLKAMDLPHQEICRLTEICPNTLRNYLSDYQKGGIDRLKNWGYKGAVNGLTPHNDTLESEFLARPPASVKEARARILSLTGVDKSMTRVRAYLHDLGLTRRKVAAVPAKADIDGQEEFKKKALSHALPKQKQVNGPSFLWMPRTSSTQHF